MQTWKFFVVRNSKARPEYVAACLNQSAARTASDLIAIVADPRSWKKHNKALLEIYKQRNPAPDLLAYHSKLMPFVYGMQFIAPIKWLIFNIMGLFKPTPRRPWSLRDRSEVSVKSASLAAAHLMLALSAQGYDSCPMEGIDESRIRRLLKLPWGSRVVMVLAIGARSDGGVWGERVRLDPAEVTQFV